jgi:hypothetical protein
MSAALNADDADAIACGFIRPHVAGIFDDIVSAVKSAYGAVKGAGSAVASFVHHPPGWLATAFPLFTTENQRYWAEKLGGSTGAQLYDAGVKALAQKYLGPQGPALVEAYNKIADDAAHGHADAREILARAPQVVKLAAASRKGPEAFRTAVVETKSAVKVSGGGGSAYNGPHLGESNMTLEHYRNTAIQAVTDAHHQNLSPAYGYFRFGVHQKIYLFPSELDARAWFDRRGQIDGYDYMAVFNAADLRAPIVEDLGSTVMHPADVGHWFLPLALGLPAGALGGYYYRKWQEGHPGKIIPGISGDVGHSVGQHWGAHILGADDSEIARRRAWPQTKALIQSAIRETLDFLHSGGMPWLGTSPADSAFVWSLESYGDTQVVPFASYEQALDHMRNRIHTDQVALAVFDKRSPHWPNPVNWRKSDDPAHEAVIAQQVSRHSPTHAVGEVVGTEPWQSIVGTEPWQSIVGTEPWQSIVGTGPWGTLVGAAIDVLRQQAQVLANEVPAFLVVVIRDAANRWLYGKFSSIDAAIEKFSRVTANLGLFTYAALFNKRDPHFPLPFDEMIGEATSVTPGPQPTIQPLPAAA